MNIFQKKCSEYILGQSMLKNAGEGGIFSHALNECGGLQLALANEIVEYKTNVEQYIAIPLKKIYMSSVPIILKHKRTLKHLILKMDTTRMRIDQANKNSVEGNDAIFYLFIPGIRKRLDMSVIISFY